MQFLENRFQNKSTQKDIEQHLGRIIKTLIISLQSRDIIFELAASNAGEQTAAHEVLPRKP